MTRYEKSLARAERDLAKFMPRYEQTMQYEASEYTSDWQIAEMRQKAVARRDDLQIRVRVRRSMVEQGF